MQLLKISLRKEKNCLACHGYILCSVRKKTNHTIFYSAGCLQSLGVVSEGMANKQRVKGKGKQTIDKEIGLWLNTLISEGMVNTPRVKGKGKQTKEK